MPKHVFAIRIAYIFIILSALNGCNTSERRAEKRYQKGIRYKERGELRQALQQFRIAVAHNPRHVNAQTELGILLCRERKYAEAIKHLLRAIEYGSVSYKPPAYIGYAHERLGDLQLSEQSYKQAITRFPGLLDVRLRLADILEAQGKRDEAADILQEVMTLKPDIEDKAVMRSRISLLRQPQTPEMHRTMAGVYIQHGNIKRGIAEYRKFEPLDPHNPETLARFGIFCAERDQFNVAATYLEKAIELGITDQPDVWRSLGMAYEELGKLSEAIETYRTLLQLQPEFHDIRLKLVDLLERVEQHTEAADLLEELFYDGQVTDTNAIWTEILQLRGEDSKKTVVQLKKFGEYNLVDLVINETAPATLLVDTNAQYTIISEEVAQRLNILLSTQTSDVHFDFFGKTIKAPLITLSSIKVGGVEVRNIPTLIWDFSDYPQIDGVLGMSFLKHFQVEFKYEDQLFVLTKLYS